MGLTWGELSESLITAAVLKRVPVLGHFELTARCNLKCKMCYVCRCVNDKDALERECSAKEWITFAKEARDAGMLYLLLTGGEVFLRHDFKEIYEEISNMGFITKINTNATMITPEIAQWLGQIPPSMVSVTLYGGSPETYEKVCGDASGYERTIRGIELLLSEGIKVEIKTTIVHGNVDDFPKIKELTEKYDVNLGIISYISPRREGQTTCPEAERLSPEELIRFDMKVDYDSRKKIRENSDDSSHEKMEVNNLISDHPFRCTCGKSNFWVTWDGRMVPCAILDDPSVPITKSHFMDTWKEFQDLCSRVPVCLECQSCAQKDKCMTCPARLKNETGCFDMPAPYLCELVEKRELMNNKDVISIA